MAKQTRSRFEYQPRNPDTVKKRAMARAGDFDSLFKDGVKLYKPREGKNLIRILPPTWDGADHYALEAFINYGIGIEEQAYFSISKMKGEKDPIAEAKKQAEREGNKKLSDSLTPTKREIMYVIDRMAEDEGPQLWSAPWSIDKAFCSLAQDEDTKEVLMLDHPEEGCDIRFYKEGTGLGTKYPAEKMRILKPSQLHEDDSIAAEWLDYITNHPITDCLNFYDYDHIASVFEGHVAKTDDDAPKPAPKKAAPPQVDEEYDEDGEFLEEVAAKPAKVTKAQVDEDEDEPPTTVSRIRERLQARRHT